MAFGKATLTGAVSTIKEGWTAFNTLIDDLLAVTSGKGASQVGVYDSAGNMAAANVEDALTEIYTDTLSARTLADGFAENSDTTTGLTWGYKAGVVRTDNTITAVVAGTIAMTDDATNYVEVDGSGNVSRNTSAFTTARIPIRQITAASGVQTVSTDKRAWFSITAIVDEDDMASNSATSLPSQQSVKAYATEKILHGHLERAIFAYKDADEIYIGAGAYKHIGTTEQVVYWDSKLTFQIGSAGSNAASDDTANSKRFVVFLDDSAIVTQAAALLDADCFISKNEDNVTVAWNEAKHGWYETTATSDRAIFGYLTDGAGNILEFFHVGDRVYYADRIESQASVDIDTAFTDISALDIPPFATLGIVSANVSGGTAGWLWRTNGQTGSTGHPLSAPHTQNAKEPPVEVVTDAAQVIEAKADASDASEIVVYTDGWGFPVGM